MSRDTSRPFVYSLRTVSECGLRLLRLKHRMIDFTVSLCNFLYVIFCLFIIGNFVAAFFDSAFARVITRKSQVHITVETLEQPSEVAHATFNVLLRVFDVFYVEALGCGGYELHQALRIFV